MDTSAYSVPVFSTASQINMDAYTVAVSSAVSNSNLIQSTQSTGSMLDVQQEKTLLTKGYKVMHFLGGGAFGKGMCS